MMTFRKMMGLVQRVTYKPGWRIMFREDADGRPYIQIAVSEDTEAALCPFTGNRAAWRAASGT